MKPWMTHEENTLRTRWAAGDSLQKIAAQLTDRTVGALKSYRDKNKMKRDARIGTQRPSVVWAAINDALTDGKPLSMAELVDQTGFCKAACLKKITERHGKGVRIGDWRLTTRKPAALWTLGNEPDALYPIVPVAQRIGRRRQQQLALAVNPFATAAGLVEAPQGDGGRVFQQSMSLRDFDEEEMAA